MSQDELTCARCGGAMEQGFVVDKGHYSAPETQEWVEGAPERSVWTGLKTKERAVRPVTTYRCARCGYLESYARA